MSRNANPDYRPDIDGLRALAVLPVLLYHAGVPGFSGGFIGVDIFFVISGFLITGIIAREIDAGEFSILTFYERRARRILPALLAMIAFVLVGASWLFLPSDFEKVAPSALAAIFFLANVWLFTETGYFQASAETTPLLHTWSLGVEEQFYIGVPILLILVARFAPGWRLKSLIALTLVSFGWAVLKQADTDGFAFYMLPTRAWELFAGSLLALGAVPAIRNRWLAEAICVFALAAIVWATASYDYNTVFPGTAAVAPVLAAAALIHCAPGTWTGRLLSLKGPVWIGLISYSLYLWHWPLIVFWQYGFDGEQTALRSAGLIAVSIAIAWASWRWIEQPFRDKPSFPSRRIWRWGAGGMGIATAAALALVMQGGWDSRFDQRTLNFARAAGDYSPARGSCTVTRVSEFSDECTLGADTSPSAIVWGDSHGVELAWVLGEQYAERGRSVGQRTRGSCPPALGYNPAKDPDCAVFNHNVMAEIAAAPSVEKVYLAGYWVSDNYREARIDNQIGRTLDELRALGKEVVLIGPIPSQRASVPRLLALRGADVPTRSTIGFAEATAWFTQNYPDWKAKGAQIIEPLDHLSRDGRTIIVAGDTPLYYDSHHLSLAGARFLLGDHAAGQVVGNPACGARAEAGDRQNGTICSDRSQGPDGPSTLASHRGSRP